MKKIFKRIGLFLKELLNIIGNILVPIVSVLIAIMAILPVPTKFIKLLKVFEYWLFYAQGTAEKIDKIIEEKEKKLK